MRRGQGDVAPVALGFANTDFVERYRIGAPLNEVDPSTFYGDGVKGSPTNPFLTQRTAHAAVAVAT